MNPLFLSTSLSSSPHFYKVRDTWPFPLSHVGPYAETAIFLGKGLALHFFTTPLPIVSCSLSLLPTLQFLLRLPRNIGNSFKSECISLHSTTWSHCRMWVRPFTFFHSQFFFELPKLCWNVPRSPKIMFSTQPQYFLIKTVTNTRYPTTEFETHK